MEKSIALMTEKMTVSGPVIHLEPTQFARILARIDEPVVVVSENRWPGKGQRYLTTYKGFVFCTGTKESLLLPDNVEVIRAGKIKMPR